LKVLVIGDTHYHNEIKGYLDAQLAATWRIINSSKPQAVIFLGDIFHYRSPDVKTLVQVRNFFVNKLQQVPGLSKVIILRGNHDSANKSDDGLTALETFIGAPSKVRLIQHTTDDVDLKFGFIPHYEDEGLTKASLDQLGNNNDIIFGHFGYDGAINLGGCYFNFSLKKSELLSKTILGHIHQYKKDDNIIILGTPWSTNHGESDYPHFIGELERIDGKWSDLKLIELNYGVRYITVPFQSLEGMKDEIANPEYFTILRVLLDKFSDETSSDLRNKILKEYKVGYVELKFQPILNKKLNNRLSDYAPTTKIESLDSEILERYLEEQASNIPKDVLRAGLDEIKLYEDSESNS
jgi:predicted phosphodiesterase